LNALERHLKNKTKKEAETSSKRKRLLELQTTKTKWLHDELQQQQ